MIVIEQMKRIQSDDAIVSRANSINEVICNILNKRMSTALTFEDTYSDGTTVNVWHIQVESADYNYINHALCDSKVNDILKKHYDYSIIMLQDNWVEIKPVIYA